MLALIVIFVLGVANFAMHKAVLVSGHPLLGQVPWYVHLLGGRISLGVEFLMLLGAMLMAGNGSPGWAWLYVGYTVVNGISAWLILNRRV